MAKAKRATKKKHPARSVAKKGPGKPAELKYIPWSSVALEDLNPLLQRQFIVGKK